MADEKKDETPAEVSVEQPPMNRAQRRAAAHDKPLHDAPTGFGHGGHGNAGPHAPGRPNVAQRKRGTTPRKSGTG